VDHDLEDLGEFLLVDEILVEAKLLDGPEDSEFLIDFQPNLNVFENLHDLVVVHGGVALLFLLEAEVLLLPAPHLQLPVDLVDFMANLHIHPEVFRVVLHPLLLFFGVSLLGFCVFGFGL